MKHLRHLFAGGPATTSDTERASSAVDDVQVRQLVGRVRWLKAVEGGVDIPMLGAKARLAKSLTRMGEAIAGTEDVVATYAKADPRAKYNEGKWRPGAIAGVLWLAPMAAGKAVFDHAEDVEYDIGWPVAARDLTPGPMLRDLEHFHDDR